MLWKDSVLDIFEGCLQRVEQFSILRAGQIGNAGPEVIRLDDIMHLAAHLLFKIGHIVGIVGIPDGQRHTAAVALDTGDSPGPVPSCAAAS